MKTSIFKTLDTDELFRFSANKCVNFAYADTRWQLYWNEDSTISENVNNTTLDLTLTIDLKFYGRKSQNKRYVENVF